MAIGRPDDIGQQFPADANTSGVQDPLQGRSQRDYGTRPGFTESFTAVDSSTVEDSTATARQFSVQAVTRDILIVKEVTISDGLEVESEDLFFVAKPIALRDATYDGEVDADGFTQTTLGGSSRQLTRSTLSGTLTRQQVISPAYDIGDRIFAIESDTPGVNGLTLLDINEAGRKWDSPDPSSNYFQITEVNRDTVWAREWDFTTDAQKVDANDILVDAVLIAKPHLLRGGYWNGKSITTVPGLTSLAWAVTGGSTENDDHLLRTATPTPGDPEDHEIIPPWWIDTTIIRAERMDLGTGAFYDGAEALWQDANDAGSAFSVVAT